MQFKRHLTALALAMGSVAAFAQATVGVSWSNFQEERWKTDEAAIKAQLEKSGAKYISADAGGSPEKQLADIDGLIAKGAKVLIVLAMDKDAILPAVNKANQQKIPVIAYDRLIRDTPNVDYYATFDNYKVGTIQGLFLEEKLDLKNAKGPFNFELFAGSPDDSNARYFHAGAWDILKPYYDEGKIVVKSGQVDFETIAILGWGTKDAQARMDNLLTNYADGTKLDAVLSPNDSLALGITNSLQAAGYTLDNFPIVTGQDCDVTNTKNIILGYQAMSVFKDTRTLAAQVVKMVEAIHKGEEVPVNDTETYFNGVIVIPSFLCDPVFADKDNYRELLIDSGYYTEEQLKVD